jgi:MoaA/NifB/PqqE/SkfB family radical SAM enzyme
VDRIAAFLRTVGQSAVQRVFLAGGEPLNWPPALAVAGQLKGAGVEVIVCTNGIPLNRPEISDRIIGLGVDAVSVSVDSADPGHHDHYRPSRAGRHGWTEVISGIQRLLAARGASSVPKVGIYAVITRRNVPAIVEVAELAAQLRADYFVPQPVSMPAGHKLHGELSLRPGDRPAITAALTTLYRQGLPLALPAPGYPDRFAATISTEQLLSVKGCFGGHTLFFIEPDGSVWDCPSSYKISATPPGKRLSILGRDAAELFGTARSTCPTDCALASRDCVNMWPLMGFGSILATRAAI